MDRNKIFAVVETDARQRAAADALRRMGYGVAGAAETAPWPACGPGIGCTTWLAMNGARWAFRPIGPMPGPPPPCGMAKVLCRFMWLTSAPMWPGEVRPTCALRLAPSMYT